MAKNLDEQQLWSMIKRKLADQGIELEDLLEMIGHAGEDQVAVVCATDDNLGVSLDELAESQRDQVVMVRVDEDTVQKLVMWTETGVVKSKSEAAALFIKEGLKVRKRELDELTDAIDDVKKAKDRLRSRARTIFGEEPAS